MATHWLEAPRSHRVTEMPIAPRPLSRGTSLQSARATPPYGMVGKASSLTPTSDEYRRGLVAGMHQREVAMSPLRLAEYANTPEVGNESVNLSIDVDVSLAGFVMMAEWERSEDLDLARRHRGESRASGGANPVLPSVRCGSTCHHRHVSSQASTRSGTPAAASSGPWRPSTSSPPLSVSLSGWSRTTPSPTAPMSARQEMQRPATGASLKAQSLLSSAGGGGRGASVTSSRVEGAPRSGSPFECKPLGGTEGLEAEARPHDPPALRADLVRWCFRRSRAQIAARYELLSHVEVHSKDVRRYVRDKRTAIGFGHHLYQDNGDPDPETALGELLELYQSAGLVNLPLKNSSARDDSAVVWDGGCARTSELVNALSVLNFHRWLCNLPQLKLCALRQTLADMLVQTLRHRDLGAIRMRPNSHRLLDYMRALLRFLRKVDNCALISHKTPSASGGVYGLLLGFDAHVGDYLSECEKNAPAVADSRSDKGRPDASEERARRHHEVANAMAKAKVLLARLQAQDSLWCYRPLFHLSEAAGCTRGGRPTPEMQQQQHEQHRRLAEGSPTDARFANWGRHNGSVAVFRRRLLDPRLRRTGMVRRGNKFCIWTSVGVSLEGESPPRNAKLKLDQNFLDIEMMQEQPSVQEAKKKASECAVKLENWRERVKGQIEATQKTGGFSALAPAAVGEKQKARPPFVKLFRESARKVLDLPNKGEFKPLASVSTDAGLLSAPPSPPLSAHRRIGMQRTSINAMVALAKDAQVSKSRRMQLEELQHLAKLEENDMDDIQHIEIPALVAFPPPGIVPFDLLRPHREPLWTLSPDPWRFMPTSTCRARVYRVRIDAQAGEAERRAEVKLRHFLVDCGGSGTPFCVMFTLAEQIKPGDAFEVELSGLSSRWPQPRASVPSQPLIVLRYFTCVEVMRPDLQDDALLRRAARDFEASMTSPHNLGEVDRVVPDNPEMLVMMRSVRGGKPMLKPGYGAAVSRGTPGNAGTTLGTSGHRSSTQSQKVRKQPTAAARLSKKEGRQPYGMLNPPPIGLIRHPEAVELTPDGPSTGSAGTPRASNFHLEVSSNDVQLALVVPRHIVLRASLYTYLHSHAKWEAVPNGVNITYIEHLGPLAYFGSGAPPKERPQARTVVQLETSSSASGSTDASPEAEVQGFRGLALDKEDRLTDSKEPRFRQLRLKILLPFPGLYEIRFWWGFAPLNASLNTGMQSVTAFEHPVVISMTTKNTVSSLLLFPFQSNVKKFGFPKKHPLSDHFGVTLLGPQRYRLKVGYCRFSVYVPLNVATINDSKQEQGAKVVKRGAGGGKSDPEGARGGQDLGYAEVQFANALNGGEDSSSSSSDDDSRPPSMTMAQLRSYHGRRASFVDVKRGPFVKKMKGPEEEDELTAHILQNLPSVAKQTLQKHMCDATVGEVVIAAVVGMWRRVEVFSRRELPTPPLPAYILAEAEAAMGTIGRCALQEHAEKSLRSEVHELVMNLTEEDDGQIVQIFVFQVGSSQGAAVTTQGAAHSGPFARPASTSFNMADAISSDPSNELLCKDLGTLTPPQRWCLAEYVVDRAEPMPYDEEEMAKQPLEEALDEEAFTRRRMTLLMRELGVPENQLDERRLQEFRQELLFGGPQENPGEGPEGRSTTRSVESAQESS